MLDKIKKLPKVIQVFVLGMVLGVVLSALLFFTVGVDVVSDFWRFVAMVVIFAVSYILIYKPFNK